MLKINSRATNSYYSCVCNFKMLMMKRMGVFKYFIFCQIWRIIMCSGFDDWIYWHFFTIAISYNSSQSMTATTCSIPYWTTSDCSSTVTDLVPIYESVTSSASVVRLLAPNSWTLNYLTNESRLLSDEWSWIHEGTPFYNCERIE
jgi:hypothetical protein